MIEGRNLLINKFFESAQRSRTSPPAFSSHICPHILWDYSILRSHLFCCHFNLTVIRKSTPIFPQKLPHSQHSSPLIHQSEFFRRPLRFFLLHSDVSLHILSWVRFFRLFCLAAVIGIRSIFIFWLLYFFTPPFLSYFCLRPSSSTPGASFVAFFLFYSSCRQIETWGYHYSK